jgi:PAS domain S-box-containing protein
VTVTKEAALSGDHPVGRVEKLTSILEVSKALTAQRELDLLLSMIVSEASKVVEADRCSLFIVDRERHQLWTKVAQGSDEISINLGTGIAGHVAGTGEAVNISDAYADPRFNRSVDLSTGYRTRNILCVPMRDASGAIAGVIQALNKVSGDFTSEDEEMLLAIGGQAAAAVENVLMLEGRAREVLLSNEKLEASVAFLRKVFQTMPGALFVFDRNGVIGIVNHSAAKMLGYSESELVGSSMARLVDPADPVSISEIEALASRGEILRTEKTCVTKGGGKVPVLFSATVLSGSGPGTEPTRIVSIAQDLCDRRRLEAELRQAQKLESVGRLAAGVAHELNTPVQYVSDSLHFARDAVKDLLDLVEKLGGVLRSDLDRAPSRSAVAEAAAAEEAADLPYLSEHLPKALDRALDGVGRVTAIIRAMKEFSHPEQRAMATVDLNRAILSALTIARNEYKYVAELETNFGELPPILCHVGELCQAILNIVLNAAHAIGDVVKGTERKGMIRVRTVRDGEHVVVSIEDTGGGIPEEVRGQVFDPFFTTKEIGKGTGQGLSIARSIVVEKHGGGLQFETEVGKGTTFFIRLPINGRPGLRPTGGAPT